MTYLDQIEQALREASTRSWNSAGAPWDLRKSAGVAVHPYRTIRTRIDIDTFLKLTTRSGSDRLLDHEYAKEVAVQMKEGTKTFGVPWLLVKITESGVFVTGHEGRHRALAYRYAGEYRIPVVLVCRKPEGEFHRGNPANETVLAEDILSGRAVLISQFTKAKVKLT